MERFEFRLQLDEKDVILLLLALKDKISSYVHLLQYINDSSKEQLFKDDIKRLNNILNEFME